MMVARDGIAQHYNVLSIPLTGIYLDPRREISRSLSPEQALFGGRA